MFKKTVLPLFFILLFASILVTGCTRSPGVGSPTATSSPAPQPNDGAIQFNQVSLQVASTAIDAAFPAGCQGLPPACTRARDGFRYLSIRFIPVHLAEGEMLVYKDIPAEVNVQSAAEDRYPAAFRSYDVANRVLVLGFEVPAELTGFVLNWPGNPPKDVAPAAASTSAQTPELTPTPAAFSKRCQVTGFQTYQDSAGRFCFAFPEGFTRDQDGGVYGPKLDSSVQTFRVSLGIEVQAAPAGGSLAQMVDEYLAPYAATAGTPEIKRTVLPLSGEPAEIAEPVPVTGLGSSRVILCLHGGSLYKIAFSPVDTLGDLAGLYQSLIATFTFLP